MVTYSSLLKLTLFPLNLSLQSCFFLLLQQPSSKMEHESFFQMEEVNNNIQIQIQQNGTGKMKSWTETAIYIDMLRIRNV